MATHTGVSSVSNTLTGTTQDVITLTAHAPNVEVVNRSNEDLWFKVAASDPGSFASDDEGVLYCAPLTSVVVAANRPTCVVRLLGDGNAYSVIALPRDGMSRVVDHNSLGRRTLTGAHPASAIAFTTPAGMSAVNAQTAIEELWAAIQALQPSPY